MAGQAIGGWEAIRNGQEPGKCIETLVESNAASGGGKPWKTFRLFKPYIPKTGERAGQWVRGTAIPLSKKSIEETVDRINHLIGTFLGGEMNGMFVFHAGTNPYAVQAPPMQQQVAPQYGQPQQYAQAPQGYAAPQQYAPQGPPAGQQQMFQQPPVQYGQPPQGYAPAPTAAPAQHQPQGQTAPQYAPQGYAPGTYIPPQG